MKKKAYTQLYKDYFFGSLKWQVPILLVSLLLSCWYYWPVDFNNYLNSGKTFWEMLLVLVFLPFLEGFVQSTYVYFQQRQPGYLEKQQKIQEAAEKIKADRAAKRAKYGRWWWLKRRKD